MRHDHEKYINCRVSRLVQYYDIMGSETKARGFKSKPVLFTRAEQQVSHWKSGVVGGWEPEAEASSLPQMCDVGWDWEF